MQTNYVCQVKVYYQQYYYHLEIINHLGLQSYSVTLENIIFYIQKACDKGSFVGLNIIFRNKNIRSANKEFVFHFYCCDWL